ncbi:MAG: uncharacterized protein KVP18_001469 [Porospora cf. gigantea A]|uniref:uncharacterized protein n=1 Tax=Porospora cf. gigantea A TaxID=2853593 RepID=UPI00355A7D03|nr:MAG: hypothetical protein KVP18_001469 [Porospora cf. gigantea A]
MLIFCAANRVASNVGLLASVLGQVGPDLREASSQKTEGRSETPTARSVSAASNPLDYWKHHYLAEDAHPALQALVPPNEMLEFYHEGVPLSIKQKSFLFACVVGLGPITLDETKESPRAARLRMLSPPDRRDLAIFNPRTFQRLSAFHALDMCDRADHVVSDVATLECLTTADRAQYLRETSLSNAIFPLNAARWFYLDAAKEAASLPLPELRVAILADMSMILQHMYKECEPNHSGVGFGVAAFVMCAALIFLSFDDDADTRLAYYFVQQSYQAVRCWLLDFSKSEHIDEYSCDEWIGLTQSVDAIRVGWRRLLFGLREDLEDNSVMEFDPACVQAILLNPFRISGRQWEDVELLEPDTKFTLPEYMKNHLFMLDSTFFAWNPNVYSASEEGRDRLNALERHVLSTFSPVGSPFTDRLWIPNQRELWLPGGDYPDTLDVVSQWITEKPRPGTLLADVTWPKEDPSRVGVRLTLATAVSAGLTSSSPLWFKMHKERDSRLLVAIDGASMKLVLLAKTVPQCYCQLSHRHPADKEKLLQRFRPFREPVAPGLILRPGCELDDSSGGFGYEANEIPQAWLAQTPPAACRSFSTKREHLRWRLKNRSRPTVTASSISTSEESESFADSILRSQERESSHKNRKKPKKVQQKAVAVGGVKRNRQSRQATLEVKDEPLHVGDSETALLNCEPHGDTSDLRECSRPAQGPRPSVRLTIELTWKEQIQDLGTLSVAGYTAK